MNQDPNNPIPGNHPTPSPPNHVVDSRLPGPFDDEVRPQDPGSSSSRFVALWAAVLLTAIAIVWQHLPEDTQYKALSLTPPPPAETSLVLPAMEATSMVGRMAIKFQLMLEQLSTTSSPSSEQNFADQFMVELEKNAITFEDRIAIAIVLGELESPDSALERITELENELDVTLTLPPDESIDDSGDPTPQFDPNAEARRDLHDLKTVYLAGSGALEDLPAQRLRSRYGYFGDIALTHDLDQSDPGFLEPRSGGLSLMLGLMLFGVVLCVAFVAGLVMLALGLIRHLGHPERARFEPPAIGGSVMLETFALFVGGFLAVSVLTTVLISKDPQSIEFFLLGLTLQLGTAVLVLWPLLRGMSFTAWRQSMGLVAPNGVLREIGFGFLAYLATVPLFIAGTVVTLIFLLIQQLMQSQGTGAPPEPPSNDILDIIANADWYVLVLIAVLATVWAPIVEELIFRGALYRHLRARLHWVFAALFTAILFAGIHNYPVFMLTPIFALGFMFAVMREIRGSIIASITAHFIHNFSLLLVMAFVIRPLIA